MPRAMGITAVRFSLPFFAGVIALATVVCGCKKKAPERAPAASAERAQPAVPEFPPPNPPRDIDLETIKDPVKKLLQLRIREKYPEELALWEAEREDRKELVRPAPPDFKPEAQGRKLKLTLIPKSTVLRKGQNFWYRAELQNVGGETVDFHDPGFPAFFKTGNVNLGVFNGFHFKLRMPSGSVGVVFEGFGSDCVGYRKPLEAPGWERMSEEERENAIAMRSIKEKAAMGMKLRILPGETLTTRPVRFVSGIEECDYESEGKKVDPRVPGPFRELNTQFSMKEPGTYTVQLVFQDAPLPIPTRVELERNGERDPERAIRFYKRVAADALGTVESNTVSVEVMP